LIHAFASHLLLLNESAHGASHTSRTRRYFTRSGKKSGTTKTLSIGFMPQDQIGDRAFAIAHHTGNWLEIRMNAGYLADCAMERAYAALRLDAASG